MTTKQIIVTLGLRRYRVERPWPNANIDFKGISDVTVLSDGRVVALRRAAPALLVFSPEGAHLDQWEIAPLVCGHYLRARKDGGLLIADFDGHQILALDNAGNCVWTLGDPSRPNWGAPFNHPTCAVEDSNGRLYVTDGYGNSCLHRYDSARRLTATIGAPGNGAAQFSTPHAVIVTRDQRVLVADRENNRVQIFDIDGNWQGQIDNVYKPMSIAEMPDGNLLVTDHVPRLSLFAPDTSLLGRCRTLSTVSHGLAVDADGTIFLAEMAPDMLTRLVPIE
jgi:outer membrane protein assembly factor BamB